MNVADLISNSQLFAGVTSAQVDNVTTLKFVNLAYHDLEEIIRNKIDEDYFYDYFTTNTILNQSEYNFASIDPTSTAQWILKIISVGVKYTSADTVYKPVKAFGSGSLSSTPEYLSANQPQSNSFYIYKDNSLFLYPAPTENSNTVDSNGYTISVANGLRVHASVSLIDLLSGWAETTVKIPRNHHKAICLKAATYIYLHRNLWGTAIAQDTDIKAAQAIQMMEDNLRDRTLTPMEQDLPILTNIQY